MNNIKNKISFVYFDVGGVAIKDFSDTDKWNIMIDDYLGIPVDKRESFDKLFDKYENDICMGKIEVDDLKPFIKEQFNPHLNSNVSLLNYFVDNFESNSSLWPIIEKIKNEGLKIGLLTDQYLGMLDLIASHGLLPTVQWDVVIDSSVERFRKPMIEMYEIAEQKAGVPQEEILLIDNRQKNLDPAAARGWQTFLYDSRDYGKSSLELGQFFSNHT